jgi:hypothetical protein
LIFPIAVPVVISTPTHEFAVVHATDDAHPVVYVAIPLVPVTGFTPVKTVPAQFEYPAGAVAPALACNATPVRVPPLNVLVYASVQFWHPINRLSNPLPTLPGAKIVPDPASVKLK